MKQRHENLLIASLAGLVIVSAAAFAVIPAHAAGYHIDQKVQVGGGQGSWANSSYLVIYRASEE